MVECLGKLVTVRHLWITFERDPTRHLVSVGGKIGGKIIARSRASSDWSIPFLLIFPTALDRKGHILTYL